MKLVEIWRYPVKGLEGESLKSCELNAVEGIPDDRLMALAFEETLALDVDLSQAPWKFKGDLAVQNDWPILSAFQCKFDSAQKKLWIKSPQGKELTAELFKVADRKTLGALVLDVLKASTPSPAARHPSLTPLVLVGGSQTRFPDREKHHVSVMNLASLRELEKITGLTIDMRRFRGNIILDGLQPFEETGWKDKRIQLGDAEIEITVPIGRCFNINVHPETGIADMDLLDRLKASHAGRFGMMARVVKAGRISV